MKRGTKVILLGATLFIGAAALYGTRDQIGSKLGEWMQGERTPVVTCAASPTPNVADWQKLNPRPNGSFYLVIDKSEISLDGCAGKVKMGDPEQQVTEGWVVRTSTSSDAKDIDRLEYSHGPNVTEPRVYVRTNNGKWETLADPTKTKFNRDNRYELVITWVDSTLDKNNPAPVPFEWKCVPNSAPDSMSC